MLELLKLLKFPYRLLVHQQHLHPGSAALYHFGNVLLDSQSHVHFFVLYVFSIVSENCSNYRIVSKLFN